MDGGLLDNFQATSCQGTINLDYYDGNTVTALWNYAQRFSMNDNNFETPCVAIELRGISTED